MAEQEVSTLKRFFCTWELQEFCLCRSEEVDLEKEFEQNELNSAVYLISIAMQISNFAVNYKVCIYLAYITVQKVA